MCKSLRFLSLFSGVGGFEVAFERVGMICVGQVEIDPFCRRVLRKHWPDVPKWKDVKKFHYEDGVVRYGKHGKEGSEGTRIGRIDVICGGFP